MATEVGIGYVSIVPEVRGFATKLQTAVGTSGTAVGTKVGKDMSDGVNRGLSQGTSGIRAKMGEWRGIMTAALGAGLLMFGRQAIQAASDQQQALGSLTAVFKTNSAAMIENAQHATQLGLSTTEYAQAAAVLGGQLLNLGVAQDQLAPTTSNLVTLAADMAAQFGGTVPEAVDALTSALRGETDPIERYAVSLNETKIKAEMAATGLDKTGATLSLLQKQLTNTGTIGAWNRESDTMAAKAAKAQAEMKNLAANLGAMLLPVMTTLNGILAKVAGAFNALPGPVQKVVVVGTLLTAALIGAGKAIAMIKEASAALGLVKLVTDFKTLSDTVGGTKAALTTLAGAWTSTALEATKAKAVMVGTWIADAARAIGSVVASIAAATGAWIANTAGIVANKIALVATAVAQGVVTVATGAWTAAQWLLNIALNANPIGLIVLAIAALVTAVVLAYQKSETFRTIVQAAWAMIKTAVQAVWDFFKDVVVPGFKVAFNILKGYVEFYVGLYIKAWDVLKAAFMAVKDFIMDTLVPAFRNGFNAIKAIVEGYLNFWQSVFGAVKTVALAVWDKIRNTFTTVFNTIKTVATNVFNGIRNVINTLLTPLRTVWNWIQQIITKLQGAPIIGTVLSKLPGFSEGGLVTGVGLRDSVPAMLTPGEYVLSRGMVASMGGPAALDRMRSQQYRQRMMAEQAKMRAAKNARYQRNPNAAQGTGGHMSVTINNPKPEPASESLPRAIRKISYVTGGAR